MSGRVTWEQCCWPFRTLRWLVRLNHTGTSTFVLRLPFWWRWESYSLTILSSGSLTLNVTCFPLSFLWSNILCIVISLQGGKVVDVGASFNAKPNTDSWSYFFHGTSIMSQMFLLPLPHFAKCHFTCMHTHPPTPHTSTLSMCTRTHMLVFTLTCSQRVQGDSSKNSLHIQIAHMHKHSLWKTCGYTLIEFTQQLSCWAPQQPFW